MVAYTRFPNGAKPPRTRTATVAGRARPQPPGDCRGKAAERDGAKTARPAPAARRGTLAPPAAAARPPLPLTLFVLSLLMPLQLYLGPLYLNPHRLVLLTLFVPLLIAWISGRAGRLRTQDGLFLAYLAWAGLTFFYNHGLGRIELVGMTVIEGLGAYLVGRILVRGPREYRHVLKLLVLALLFLAPAAVLESTTGIRVYSRIADAIADTYNWVHANPSYQKRLGMYRAHTVFEHPILFGVFAATAFGLLYHRIRPGGQGTAGYRLAWLSLVNTFFSLSSGALLSVVTQIGITMWDRIMHGLRNHWKLLIGLTVAGYVVIDLLSNRTPMEVFISYATFNAGTGYMRIIIFDWGMKNVLANPLFGLGMRDWVRPGWLSPSVDNFWLVNAMRHGIPGFLFIAGTFLSVIVGLGRLKIGDPEVALMRKGLVIAFIGLSMSLVTVHIWGPTYAFVCFLLGASAWIRDRAGEDPEVAPAGAAAGERRASKHPRRRPAASSGKAGNGTTAGNVRTGTGNVRTGRSGNG